MKLHIILHWKPTSPTSFSSNSLVCTFHRVTQCWYCIAAPFGKENIPACFLWDSSDQVRSQPGFDSSWVMRESTPGPRDTPVTQSHITLGVQGLVMQTGKQNPTHDMFLQVAVTQIHPCILPSFSSVKVKPLSRVRLFVTPWTVASVHTESCRLLCPWDFPGKSTGVGCCFLLQEIFPTHGLNPRLLHCRQTLYHLSHQGRPYLFIFQSPSPFLPSILQLARIFSGT